MPIVMSFMQDREIGMNLHLNFLKTKIYKKTRRENAKRKSEKMNTAKNLVNKNKMPKSQRREV